MELNPAFMQRCLQLARKGEGFTCPNPMVGAVVVHHNRIIGEGYHRQYGEDHAEVNAIAAVKERTLLPDSTLYVSLEPCSHHGKTPPCTELIIKNKIPRVVVATKDPNPAVSGAGIDLMRKHGIEVTLGVMEEESRELNRIFFTNQLFHRPYVILKWAQSKDRFMDHPRTSLREKLPALISNKLTHTIVHKLRTQVQGILVGTQTALLDNPQLTARKWYGQQPIRIAIDKENKIPTSSALFNKITPTIVFTAAIRGDLPNEAVKQIVIDFQEDTNIQILQSLYQEGIYSLLVEGGARLLSSFIEKNMWDEAYVETSETMLHNGVKAPEIQGKEISTKRYLDSRQLHIKCQITRNFL
jgi:diaminohydroxyphosphoribosylaminopyrimidine deaminase/5-amino-6-(5-phosphoribosylamino)uracil reductase